jgi:hypothetical protein
MLPKIVAQYCSLRSEYNARWNGVQIVCLIRRPMAHIERPPAGMSGIVLMQRFGPKQTSISSVLYIGIAEMPLKNERVELEMKIIRNRQLMRRTNDDELLEQFAFEIAALQQKLREIDE